MAAGGDRPRQHVRPSGTPECSNVYFLENRMSWRYCCTRWMAMAASPERLSATAVLSFAAEELTLDVSATGWREICLR